MLITPVPSRLAPEGSGILGYDAIVGGTVVGHGSTHVNAILSALGFSPFKVAMAVAFVAEHGKEARRLPVSCACGSDH